MLCLLTATWAVPKYRTGKRTVSGKHGFEDFTHHIGCALARG